MALAARLPVRDGLRDQTGLGIVMLSAAQGWVLISGKRPSNTWAMADGAAGGAAQQRLIGRVLNQGMLEEVRRLRRRPR